MCIRCTRRAVLVGAGVLTIDAATNPYYGQASEPRFGCSYAAAYASLAAARETVLSTSGDDRLDRALISELRETIKIFPVNPGFKFIEDRSPNAYATSDTIVPGTTGTVYIGINLIKSEINAHQNTGGIAVAGICAHECAHIIQFFKKELADALEDRETKSGVFFELHADLMAGYYLRRRGWQYEMVQAFAESLFNIGDYLFNNPDHHGTPAQRVSAMRQGYSEAMRDLTVDACATQNVAFVKGLVGRRPLKIE